MTRGRLQNGLLAFLAVVFLSLIVLAGILWERRTALIAENNQTSSEASQIESGGTADHSLEYYAERQASALVDIVGPITALGNTCTIDARCSLTVGGKTVLYHGGPSENSPNGALSSNMYFFRGGPAVGKDVTIKARAYNNGTYSIINCTECFIRENIGPEGIPG